MPVGTKSDINSLWVFRVFFVFCFSQGKVEVAETFEYLMFSFSFYNGSYFYGY